MTKLSIVASLGLAVLLSACADATEMSLVEVMDNRPKDPTVLVEPAQLETAQSDVMTEDQQREATIARLRELSLVGKRKPGLALSSSVAELERLQATHGENALSEIEAPDAN